MTFLLGTKQYMTQVFGDDGAVIPVTIVASGEHCVTQVKTLERDGYCGIQLGFGAQKMERLNKAQQGHLTGKGAGSFRYLRECRLDDVADFAHKEGDILAVSDVLSVGDTVSVSAISKGKGFQGVVKRHNFAGGRRSHGQKHSEREPGSIGATGPQRVFKGTRMTGRMGADRVTIKNLRIVQIDTEKNLIAIQGAVPGRKGTLVEIHASTTS
jgi:large subunit ribosomal protein L3